MCSQGFDVSVSLDNQQLQDLLSLDKAIQDSVSHLIPDERLEHLLDAGLIRMKGASKYVLTQVGASVLVAAGNDSLDKRLEAAGMISVAEMLRGAPLDAFMTHAGVHNLETFGQWLQMRRGEMLRMVGRYDLGEKPKDDELYEWVTSHSAVLGEVHVNFKAAISSPAPDASVH